MNIMLTDVYELSIKALVGEELSLEEKKLLQDYDAKYKLVRYLVLEKQKHDGVDMVDFQFTPGNEFLSMPIVDLVNSILATFKMPTKPLNFGDFSWKDAEDLPGRYGNPPHTGMAKKSLLDE